MRFLKVFDWLVFVLLAALAVTVALLIAWPILVRPVEAADPARTQDIPTLVEVLDLWVGGAATTLLGAFAGRLMFHATEVKRGKRRFFGRELVWELPIAIGMAIIGEGAAAYFDLPPTVSTGLIAALAYLGPRGVEVLLINWIGRKGK